MNERDSVAAVPTSAPAREDTPETVWFDDSTFAGAPTDLGSGLVSLAFIRMAIRRSRRFWGGLAAVGLLLGLALSLVSAPASQSSTTLLLAVGPEAEPGTAILNDKMIAQSRKVAEMGVQTLGLRESADSFLSTYSATVVTDRVLRIDVTAPTPAQVLRRADVIASSFLTFRARELQLLQDSQSEAFDQELADGVQRVASIQAQINQLPRVPASGSQKDQLDNLRNALDHARGDLATLKGQVSLAKANAQQTTAQMVGQSKVLDAATLVPAPSRVKTKLLYAVGGLLAGLVVGLSIVIIHALVSDCLRTRDDIAIALGAPVGLSVTTKPVRIRRPGRRGLAGAKRRDIQRIVAFLNKTLHGLPSNRGLAVVPVDDSAAAALCVVSLALTWARWQKSVVVADLCEGRPGARLLGIGQAGIHAVTVDGTDLTVVVPSADEVAPVGPLAPVSGSDQPVAATEVTDACASADLMVVLVSLDPSTGSDHLATWATDAVITVTAGRASWTRIHAVGEMVRLAGTRLVSAVLLGADPSDESLGRPIVANYEPEAGRTDDATRDKGPAHARLVGGPANGSPLPPPGLDSVKEYGS